MTCVICQEDYGLELCASVRPCGHRFCEPCIERWLESCSQCPLCKQEIDSFLPAGDSQKERTVSSKRLAVPASDESIDADEFYEDAESDEGPDVACEICGGDGDDAFLLLCDGCNAAYHTYCLRPRLRAVPEGTWYCPACDARQRDGIFVGRPIGRASYRGPGAATRVEARTPQRASREDRPARLSSGSSSDGLLRSGEEAATEVSSSNVVPPTIASSEGRGADDVPPPPVDASAEDVTSPRRPLKRLRRVMSND